MGIFDEKKIDCHNHLFDPVRFPYRSDTVYRPSGQEVGTSAQFKTVMDASGVQHALLVGPTSGYRTDNACMLDAIAQGQGRFKGIAVVENEIDQRGLLALRDAGVVGIAFNPAMEGVQALADAEPLFHRLADLDMFAQIQVAGDQLLALTGLIDKTRTRILIDHCGRPDPQKGLHQAGFKALLDLAKNGRTVVKISGLQKISSESHPYEDVQVYARALISTFGPEACVWGSDWPFLRAPERLDYAPLLCLFETLVPDGVVRRTILWETPRRLFGFV
ncbi:amidohydrolase family protein [Robbsia andropogonis]|uniref:amidohydrolase family protein n=1 Tax=Robbsia andropogonis TaxID=28092 RepID=UPI003D241BEE